MGLDSSSGSQEKASEQTQEASVMLPGCGDACNGMGVGGEAVATNVMGRRWGRWTLSFKGNLGERKVGMGVSHGWLPGGGEEVINGERKKSLFEPGRGYMELHYPILSASAGLKFSS